MSKPRRSLLLAVLVTTCIVTSQTYAQDAGLFTVIFGAGVPRGAFSDHIARPGYGILVNAGARLGETPVYAGGELGLMSYGNESGERLIERTKTDVIEQATTEHMIFPVHLFVRLQPTGGVLRPYLQGLAGVKAFSTVTRIGNPQANSQTSVDTEVDHRDAALSYGGGIGVDVRVMGSAYDGTNGYVQVGVDYLIGREAKYLKEGSISTDSDGGLTFDLQRSRTTMLVPRVGFMLGF